MATISVGVASESSTIEKITMAPSPDIVDKVNVSRTVVSLVCCEDKDTEVLK